MDREKSGSKSGSRSQEHEQGEIRQSRNRRPAGEERTGEKSVAKRKVLLRQKGLPVSGRKSELIERLLNGYSGPKPKP
ncbi:hypothetical protein ACHAWF_000916 [Thalassiosira exigua]